MSSSGMFVDRLISPTTLSLECKNAQLQCNRPVALWFYFRAYCEAIAVVRYLKYHQIKRGKI